ncbi:MAG TPA: hypothetical protein VJ719_15185 [Chthoniobacterales bacterium]|nr:hypothetical protein [Chthoniobacterales bacterium]
MTASHIVTGASHRARRVRKKLANSGLTVRNRQQKLQKPRNTMDILSILALVAEPVPEALSTLWLAVPLAGMFAVTIIRRKKP